MKRLLCFLGLVLLIVGCEKVESGSQSLQGRYTGLFSRTGMDTAQVSLMFEGERFEGQSNKQNYPAVCSGTVDLENNTISFTDACSWTANFDWSLILSGKYNINFSEGTVRIWKTNGAITDEYLLRQPSR